MSGRLEHCYLCDIKFKLENENSVENHNIQHQEELEGIKFSNNMKDAVKTICKLCMCPMPMSRMREHTKRVHNVHISEYKAKYDIASDRGYEIVERIFHRCGICNHPFPLDSDLVAGHIRKHNITHANYNAKYMIIKTNDPERKHSKQKSRAGRPPSIKEEVEQSQTELMPHTAEESNIEKFDKTRIGMMKFDESNKVSESPMALTAERLFSLKPTVKEKTLLSSFSTPKSPKPAVSEKEEAQPALSYAEQISMFLRGKQIVDKSFQENKEEIKNISDIDTSENTTLEIKPIEGAPAVKPNQLAPSTKPSENIVKTDALNEMTHPDQKSSHETPSSPITLKPVVSELSPVKTSMFHVANNNNNASTSSALQNLRGPSHVPETPFESGVISNKSNTDRKNIIRILTPQTINENYENEKNYSIPIKSSHPLNILHQNPIKKVKLKNGKVLHLFINKNSKISKPPITEKGGQNADKGETKDCVEDPINIKDPDDNLKDPLQVDTDVSAVQVPDTMDVDIVEKPPDQSVKKGVQLKNKAEAESESRISDVVTDRLVMETELVDKDKIIDSPVDRNEALSYDDSNPRSPMNEEKKILNNEESERCMETNKAFENEKDPGIISGRDEKGEAVNGTDSDKCILEADKRKDESEMEVDNSHSTGCSNPDEEIKETEKDEIHSSIDPELTNIPSISNQEVTNSGCAVAVASEQDSFIEGSTSNDKDTSEKTSISPPDPDSTHDDSGFTDMELSDVASDSVSSNLSPMKINELEKDTTELITRLASKTKQMLSKSPFKDENVEDIRGDIRGSVETIEKTQEFTNMMKRITDNMAVLNGNKEPVSLDMDKHGLESNGESIEDGLLSENELDLVVEDIWNENFS